ncbi:MAG: glycosyltransferase family 2 protein [Polyangiaceae bacterium]|nr:glycosyltransferase family 2 protein [Polyangiaceae bacterium]
MTQTVCLNMIVKNEAYVIRRCLDSALPHISSWVIVDTGSTDDTRELVCQHLASVPGELHERPWRHFGHNRTEALDLARGKADYILVLDADEVLEVPSGFAWPVLTADAYLAQHRDDRDNSYWRVHLVRDGLPWRFVGPVHEVVQCLAPCSVERMAAVTVRGLFDGARNADRLRKFERDIELLKTALNEEPDNPRYLFYLAQSYRDCNQFLEAIDTYERRFRMGGWEEEAWCALYQAARVRETLGGDFAEALQAYLRAYQYRTTRAEPLYHLARHYREAGDYALAHLFAAKAVEIPPPNDILFVEQSVYLWKARDELAVASFFLGQVQQAAALLDDLLASDALPADERPRLEKNRRLCERSLRSQNERPAVDD